MDVALNLFSGKLWLKEPSQKNVFDQLSHCLGHSNLLSCVSLRIVEKLTIW